MMLSACVATGPVGPTTPTVIDPVSEVETLRRIAGGVLFVDVETCRAEQGNGLRMTTCDLETRAFVRDGPAWRHAGTIPTERRSLTEGAGDDACPYTSEIRVRSPLDLHGGGCVEIREATMRRTSGSACPASRGCAVNRRVPYGAARATMPSSMEMWRGPEVPDLRGAWQIEEDGWHRASRCTESRL